MQVLNVIWLRWLLVLLAAGLALAFVMYLAFVPSYRRPEQEAMEEYPAGIQVGSRPVPPLLILLFALVGACMVGYLAYVWTSGVAY
jgi:hypothetical protein